MELKAFVEKRNGNFFSDNSNNFPSSFENADVIFFVFYPLENSNTSHLNVLKNIIKQRNVPLCIITGKSADSRTVQFFSDVIPLENKIVIKGMVIFCVIFILAAIYYLFLLLCSQGIT